MKTQSGTWTCVQAIRGYLPLSLFYFWFDVHLQIEGYYRGVSTPLLSLFLWRELLCPDWPSKPVQHFDVHTLVERPSLTTTAQWV